MDRREFVKTAFAAPLLGAVGMARAGDAAGEKAASRPAGGSAHPLAGKTLPAWKPGEFQVHFIYTGVAESMFWIMPDGTTMLLDCGDHPAVHRGKKAVWVLPSANRYAGEWIARYVQRVNPSKNMVDYLMVSHHHADHAGMGAWGAGKFDWNGKQLTRSGIVLAAETLKFGTFFDRGWPDWNDPIPNERCDMAAYPHVRDAVAFLSERDGTKMEKFEVGAMDQIRQLKSPEEFPSFHVANITGNGKIRRRDGTVRDLYENAHDAKRLNENAMSLGVVVKYGPFRFYTAGDFYDTPKHRDGTRMNIEVELAKEVGRVDVAKMNHHGHHSMSLPLVAALRPRVWTACTWDQLHVTADTLERVTSREAYPGPRLVAPGVFSPMRRIEDAGKPFIDDIAPESFDAGHVVLTVAPGGEDYSIAYVKAENESMAVTGAYDFKSGVADA